MGRTQRENQIKGRLGTPGGDEGLELSTSLRSPPVLHYDSQTHNNYFPHLTYPNLSNLT